MSSSTQAPPQPGKITRLCAWLGPYPFLASAALTGTMTWSSFEAKLPHVLGPLVDFGDIGKEMVWSLTRSPQRKINRRRLQLVVIPLVSLFPEGPLAWYAVRSQRKVEEWERWQQRRTELVNGPPQATMPAGSDAWQKTTMLPDPARVVVGNAQVSRDTVEESQIRIREHQAHSAPPPPRRRAVEFGYRRWERDVADAGYTPWFVVSGLLGAVATAGAFLGTNPGDRGVDRQVVNAFKANRPVALLSVATTGLTVTCPIGAYIWWCRHRVADRDIAAARAPLLVASPAPAVQKQMRPADRRDGATDDDRLVTDRPAGKEEGSWD